MNSIVFLAALAVVFVQRSECAIKTWPNGVVPVAFDDSVDGFAKEKLLASMNEIQISTDNCIQFVPREAETDYVEFSTVNGLTEIPVPGVNNGKQFVKIADNLEKADMMQLLVYSLGMYNTFRRPDRDSFVNVMYDNIKDEYQQYFAISNDTTFVQSRFDFDSITFFYPYAYAKDASKPTLTAKYEGEAIPWKVSLSISDVHNLKRGYGCGGETNNRMDLLKGLSHCNFEDDLCTYQNDPTADFEFQRRRGPTPTTMTGPNSDYSSGIGYYLLAEARTNNMENARLLSQTIAAGEYCVRFYYHMFGDNVRKLRIMARNNGNDVLLEEMEGNQGNEWHRYTKAFTFTQPTVLVLEAIVGRSDTGDIAIDDIYIYNGKCIV
ncbi:nematocyst expressed protein 6-like [Mytilus trossulus]|uniref:nematocyst expressed protein 6-like n=1 Tax=Mytilus trossulus TaxID=6551 RepID=UPI0030041FCD